MFWALLIGRYLKTKQLRIIVAVMYMYAHALILYMRLISMHINVVCSVSRVEIQTEI